MTFHNLVIATALALSAVVPGVAVADVPSAAGARLAGTYAYAGGEQQQKARLAAIEKATDDMFFVTRRVARGRLKDRTAIWANVGFSFDGGMITTTMSKLPTATSPENGAAVAYRLDGDKLRLSQKVAADGRLVQSFANEDGTRTNTYTLSPDGRTLNIAVTVASSQLPAPVSYTLTYVRR
jgi:hypothetical protein